MNLTKRKKYYQKQNEREKDKQKKTETQTSKNHWKTKRVQVTRNIKEQSSEKEVVREYYWRRL